MARTQAFNGGYPVRWLDILLGPAVRRGPGKSLYLTFDDGPDEELTSRVLDLLKAVDAQATFFIVVERAKQRPELIARILREGHALGNHSLDHRYRAFFSSEKTLADWIDRSEQEFKALTGTKSIGFRPPAGVRTPPLKRVLRAKKIPLILWSTRFFDAIHGWKKSQAERAFKKISGGEIILLHDRQRREHAEEFLRTLKYFLSEGQTRGFEFTALRF